MTAVDKPLPGPSANGYGGEALLELTDAPDAAQEDRALLDRLRAGEDSAFGELFARHSRAVRRLAYGLVSDRSEAEDLTAEAFFRVLQAIRRGAGPVDNVRGYLLIVARRVAWEWRARHRDVPVSDEELTHRAGTNPDTSGQSTERNLITRAFASLPERWRSVLWKVEVEGERPAVVATNFGLSANATAALARRARQGLRAAYLQAHLAADRSATGCRQVLEKLGAYTAGSIKGSERRRIRAHLAGCPSCTTMHAELRDVCSGLRAHAGMVAVPVAAVGAWQAISTGGLGATVKGQLASAKLQVAMAASSAAVIGVLGVVAGPWGGQDRSIAHDDLDGRGGLEIVISEPEPPEPSVPMSIAVTTGHGSTAAVVPSRQPRGNRRGDAPVGGGGAEADKHAARAAAAGQELAAGQPRNASDGYDENAPVVYRETNVERRTEQNEDYTTVCETTTVVEVNSADQTRTSTETRKYTTPNATGRSTTDDPRATGPPPSSTSSTTSKSPTTTKTRKSTGR